MGKLICLSILSLLLFGCTTTPQVIYRTQYQKVEVPVVYKLDRPSRPEYLPDDTPPVYLLKLKQYITTLEVMIDKHNGE